jgi:hypothetical protein
VHDDTPLLPPARINPKQDDMNTAYLIRLYKDNIQTLGVMSVPDKKQIFACRTLELEDILNTPNISCIPDGEYLCKWTYSPHLQKFTYQVMDVPDRSGIRIHSANFFKQLQGCIALGDNHKDIDMDSNLDVIHSGTTVNEFNNIFNMQDFKLIIRSEV